jgi:flagellar hook-length control protein FliK
MQGLLPPSLLAATPVLPAANPPPASPRAAAPNANTFSRQLEQSRQRAQENARPAPEPAAPPPAAQKPAAAPPPAPAKPQDRSAESARTEAQRAAAARGPRKGDAPARTESVAAKGETDADADVTQADRADGSDADPAALGGLLGLVTPPALDAAPINATATDGATLPEALPPGALRPAPLPDAGATQATPTNSIAGADSAVEALANGNKPTTVADASAGQARAVERDARGAASTPGTESATWQHTQAALLAEGLAPARDAPSARLADGSDRSVGPLGALGGLASPAAGSTAARPAEVAQASLAAPATSPEFRAALGAQVSFFARAGVQQAELHLNPADMGPVSIQIVLDGQQAQVNFGADSALTRQIIESGMPELAGALRDAGLTLTGGGVSQHAGGQRQDGNGSGSAGGNGAGAQSGMNSDGTSEAQTDQVRRSSARIAQGGVDLYA